MSSRYVMHGAVIAGLLVFSAVGNFNYAKAQSDYSVQDVADIKCVAAYSFVLGNIPDETTEADRNGIVSLLTYFVGKLKGRLPDLQLSEILTPKFVNELEPEMKQEIERCGGEAEEMSADLDAASQILKGSAH